MRTVISRENKMQRNTATWKILLQCALQVWKMEPASKISSLILVLLNPTVQNSTRGFGTTVPKFQPISSAYFCYFLCRHIRWKKHPYLGDCKIANDMKTWEIVGNVLKVAGIFSTELKYSVPWLQSETSAMIFRETDAILRWRRNLKHFLSAWNDSWLERSMWWFHFICCALKFGGHIFLLQINIPLLKRNNGKLIDDYN